MKPLLVSTYGLGKCFDGQYVLKDFWIELRYGTVVGLCGMNQSGKTLAAKILSGELPADGGKICIESVFYRDPGKAVGRLRGISRYMGKGTHFFDELSIADNYALLCNKPAFKIIQKKDITDIDRQLKNVHFDTRADRIVSDLPFGKREYCEILLTMLSGAKLVLLDEKLDAIYRWNKDMVRQLLRLGKDRNICFLLISNNLEMLMELCDEISVIRSGYSAMQISSEEFNREKLICMMSGENPVVSSKKNPPAKICSDEIVFYAEKFRLEKEDAPLDFSLCSGEILGILSLNNRWNQLLAETLAGTYQRFFGSLFLGKRKLKAKELHAMRNRRQKICVLSNPVWRNLLFREMSIEDNLILPSMQKIAVKSLGYLGKRLNKFARGQLREAKILDMAKIGHMQIDELDSSASMRLVMERIRIYHPAVLVIMGLTENADIHLREAVFEECRRCAERGIGILLISSDVQEILTLCSRVLMIKNRKKLCEFCVKGTENPEKILDIL